MGKESYKKINDILTKNKYMKCTHYMISKVLPNTICTRRILQILLIVLVIVIFNKIYVSDSKNSGADGITVKFNLHVIGFNFNLQHVDVV